jgi:hypothetical protein
MTFNEAAMERLLDYLRKSGHWNIAEGFRDAIEMATALEVQRNRGRTLSDDETAFLELMRTFPTAVGDRFG